jgi:anti-sigma B factor antagonist
MIRREVPAEPQHRATTGEDSEPDLEALNVVQPTDAMANGFECFIAHQDGRALIVVRGELDMATAPVFSAVLDDAIAASPNVEINMEDVTFLDSGGLRVIAVAAVGVQPDGSITIRNPSRAVTRALAVTGLDSQLNLEGDGVFGERESGDSSRR